MNHWIIFRRAISSLVVILPGCVAQESASSHKPPRVVVMCSVDQLASWVFDQSLPHFGEGGFRRLLREGVQFAECAYLHGCTETGPGHATLGTGAPANVHGIVHNEWYDEVEKKRVY
ncbi:MAG: alkaline phosphatase family protein, partial [Planctomycetota bacterium]